jgi:hypothetical protein
LPAAAVLGWDDGVEDEESAVADRQSMTGRLMLFHRDKSTCPQFSTVTAQDPFQKPDDCLSPAAFATNANDRWPEKPTHRNESMEVGVQSDDDATTLTRAGEDVLVSSPLHTEFGHMPALVAKFAEEGHGVSMETLIKKEFERNGFGVVHAAGISDTSSARFAAANSRAWRMSSSSRSG